MFQIRYLLEPVHTACLLLKFLKDWLRREFFALISCYAGMMMIRKKTVNQNLRLLSWSFGECRVCPIIPRFTLSRNVITFLGSHLWSNRTSELGISVNCIWCWGSSPRGLGNAVYSFMAITTRPTLYLLGFHLWVKYKCVTI